MKVLIVGAGPTGLTAAIELARHGIFADVIEKRADASKLSRAVGILPSSMAILEPSGVSSEIRREAIAFSKVIFHKGADQLAKIPLASDDPSACLFGLAQDRTEALMAEAFKAMGGQIHYGVALAALQNGPGKVAAHFAQSKHHYDYVIGADGVRSTVRASLGVPFHGAELDGKWSIADVHANNWANPTAFKIFLKEQGGVTIVAPLDKDRFRVIANRPDALASLPTPMEVTHTRRAASFNISVRQVENYQIGRVFLAGDAAHCHSPVGGRGMNLGIADAADLAARLANGTQDGYHASCHPIGAKTIRFTETGRKIMTSSNPITRGVVTTAWRMAANVPAIRQRLVRQLLN